MERGTSATRGASSRPVFLSMPFMPSFTGRTRKHRTSPLVRVTDVLARVCITVGGIGTIGAVTLVCVFLVWVVVPLFRGATVSPPKQLASSSDQKQPIREGLDEYQMLGWSLSQDGGIATFRLDDGRPLDRAVPKGLYAGAPLSAWSAPDRVENIALGFADGSIQLGRIGFASRLLDDNEITEAMRALKPGEMVEFAEKEGEFARGLVKALPDGQYRLQRLNLEFEKRIKPASASAVQKIDLTVKPRGELSRGESLSYLAALSGDGVLRLSSVEKTFNDETEKFYSETASGELTLSDFKDRGPVQQLLISGGGNTVYLIWETGWLVRLNTRDIEEPKVMEVVDLLEASPGSRVTAARFLLGKETLLVGDSTGWVRAWFEIESPRARAADRHTLAAVHSFAGPTSSASGGRSAVTALAASSRSRTMAIGFADGQVRLVYLTNEKRLAEVLTEQGKPVLGVQLAPRDDGILAETDDARWLWRTQPGHPEITLQALFGPVWYEGNTKPAHVWQTTGGDVAEPKYGLWPLVFGTLKATFYSLLLAVPLALLAAIYTSEFLNGPTKAILKPSIEMMASLPSVVLGFLAALVLAPFVDRLLPAMLAGFLTIPGAFLLIAYLWQLLPEKLTLRLQRFRFGFLCLILPLGLLAAPMVGWLLEQLCLPATSRTGSITAPTAVPGLAGFCCCCLSRPWCSSSCRGATSVPTCGSRRAAGAGRPWPAWTWPSSWPCVRPAVCCRWSWPVC